MIWIPPMEPISCNDVKEDSEYIHEIKWDGIRGLVYLHQNELRMFTKKGNERTLFYPELGKLKNEFKGIDAVFDGEIVVLDRSGFPSFHNVFVRETVKSSRNLQYYLNNYPINYIVFDILQYNGKILTKQPLEQRKKLLTELFDSKAERSDTIQLSEVFHNGKELYQMMKQNNMEGIVSKKINSYYIEGKKHDAWFKTKFTKKMLCILGGIQWKDNKPNSLLLGIKTDESKKLIFMGKASLGLKEADLQLLKQYRNELEQKECPFEAQSISDVDKTGTEIMWANPAITCWVSFLELSNVGHFRHPKIIGFAAIPIEEADGKVLTD